MTAIIYDFKEYHLRRLLQKTLEATIEKSAQAPMLVGIAPDGSLIWNQTTPVKPCGA